MHCSSDKVAAAIKGDTTGTGSAFLPEMRETAVSLPAGVLGGHVRLGVPGTGGPVPGTGDGA